MSQTERKVLYEDLEGDIVYEGEKSLYELASEQWLREQMAPFYKLFNVNQSARTQNDHP